MKAQRRRAKRDTKGKRAVERMKRTPLDLSGARYTFTGRDGIEYPAGLCGYMPPGCKRLP